MPPRVSRLQKLLNLLENGTSDATRKAAAKQIADIAKNHPEQLPSILRKVSAYLHHKTWETRVAAGAAIGLLADHFAHISVQDLAEHCQATGSATSDSSAVPSHKVCLTFKAFNLQHVMDKGSTLLASGGQEYDLAEDPSITPKQRIEKMRQQLKKRLGLDRGMEGLLDTEELLQDDDLDLVVDHSKSKQPAASKQQPSELLTQMQGLSARERNKLKRKAKALGKADSCKPGEVQAQGTRGPGATVPETSASQKASDDSAADQDEEEWKETLAGAWPFQRLCDQLCVDVLDPCWEVRHGAAVALREVLRSHAACAAVQAPISDQTQGWCSAGGTGKRPLDYVSPEALQAAREANASWLEDCLVLLLCVLALDRFGDYGSDQVTAPVRETAAQALGMALQPMGLSTVQCVVRLVQQLMEQALWDVRCGGFLGLKYTLAGRLDLGQQLLEEALPALLAGLQDVDDDVRAASADALVPMAPTLFQLGPAAVRSVRTLLWELLGQLEELSPAIMSVMTLLAQLYGSEAASAASGTGSAAAAGQEQAEGVDDLGAEDQLRQRVPRLWLFLQHSMSAVRLSTVQCLERLLLPLEQRQQAAGEGNGAGVATAASGSSWLQPLLPVQLILTFQNLLVEADERVLACTVRVWQLLLACSGATDLTTAAAPQLLRTLLGLAATPTGCAFELSNMCGPYLDTESGAINLLTLAQVAAKEEEAAAARDRATRAAPPSTGPRKRARKGAEATDVGVGAAGAASAVSGASTGVSRRAELVVGAHGEPTVTRMRLLAAEALGHLLHKLQEQESCNAMLAEVLAGLQGTSATLRSVSSLVLWYWRGCSLHAQEQQTEASQAAAAVVAAQLHELLKCPGGATQPHLPVSAEPYSEASTYYDQLRREALALVTACMTSGFPIVLAAGVTIDTMTVEQALALAASLPPETAAVAAVAAALQRLQSMAVSLQGYEHGLHLAAAACCAAAAVRAGQLPAKLNQVIQPLMNALRKEPEPPMQALYGSALAELMLQCASRTPCPNDKLARNICTMACSDPAETPSAAQVAEQQQRQMEERRLSHKAAGPLAGGPGVAADGVQAGNQLAGVVDAVAAAAVAEGGAKSATASAAADAARCIRLGAEATLKCIAKQFGPRLWEQVPALWTLATAPITATAAVLDPTPHATTVAIAPLPAAADTQQLIHALQIFKSLSPHVAPELLPSLMTPLPALMACSRHGSAVVRASCCRCLAALTSAWLDDVMPPLLRLMVPMLGSTDEATRLGAVEVCAALVSSLGFRLVAYAVLLVVPLLRRMSDSSEAVRRSATACFGSLVALLPLAQGMAPPAGLDSDQLACMAQDSAFLSQLLDSRQAEDFHIPESLELPVTLRPYQQEGINWLAFLRRFGLHGVLADDMGLGKTLQALCIMGASAMEEWETYVRATSGASGAAAAAMPPWPRPCLVVCPSTLVAHWCHEVSRYVSPKALRPVQYQGTPGERQRQQAQLAPSLLAPGVPGALPSAYGPDGSLPIPKYNLVVMSYETLRGDVDWVSSIPWLYCVLDEGHIIKSPKARITMAVKRVPAVHRLLLSGTPIQNNVLELWSLFDFLMPGFLGTEKEFNAKYGKAVQAARYSKRGSREMETGLLAVEALHKQVMPFVLRRTKAQVLQDLPPKIVQDIYCDMSPLQMRLYEDFQASSAPQEVMSALSQQRSAADDGGGSGGQGQAHALRALQYMRKLCSHPALVIDWKVPEHRQAVQETLGLTDASDVEVALRDLEVAPKLAALRDLLAQCGVTSMPGAEEPASTDGEEGSGCGHRLLVFAQMKGMLDLVERDVLMPRGVSFLRLDGSMDPNSRFSVVQRFNSDPTIDVLLLTTAVGGLGLNLTSADTVVFLEHDWNPTKDLQAMDRAHRLGQTRTVNVYRLLMRNTIEEKVMALQQFKTDIANTVANQDNISLKEMDAQVLDLFGASAQAGQVGEGKDVAAKKQSGLQAVLNQLGNLWDESQYTDEFSMDSFISKVGGAKAAGQG